MATPLQELVERLELFRRKAQFNSDPDNTIPEAIFQIELRNAWPTLRAALSGSKAEGMEAAADICERNAEEHLSAAAAWLSQGCPETARDTSNWARQALTDAEAIRQAASLPDSPAQEWEQLREACAKACHDRGQEWRGKRMDRPDRHDEQSSYLLNCAFEAERCEAAIRALPAPPRATDTKEETDER